jgi:hypothetical protein
MKNINPSRNVNRRGRFYFLLGLFVTLIGLISLALGVLLFALPLLGETLSSPVGLCLLSGGVVAAAGGGFSMFRGTTLKKDNLLAYDVGESMRSFLGSDARYTFIRNISKQRVGYVDGVLVGPPGVLVFRTVDYKGEWINERSEWKIRSNKGRLQQASTNPTRECARDVYALRKYFEKESLARVPVYGVVVFTAERSKVKLVGQAPVVPIAEKHTLFAVLSQDYLKEERINSPQIRKTVDVLID